MSLSTQYPMIVIADCVLRALIQLVDVTELRGFRRVGDFVGTR